jgi:hypothetical protein
VAHELETSAGETWFIKATLDDGEKVYGNVTVGISGNQITFSMRHVSLLRIKV